MWKSVSLGLDLPLRMLFKCIVSKVQIPSLFWFLFIFTLQDEKGTMFFSVFTFLAYLALGIDRATYPSDLASHKLCRAVQFPLCIRGFMQNWRSLVLREPSLSTSVVSASQHNRCGRRLCWGFSRRTRTCPGLTLLLFVDRLQSIPIKND